MVNDNAAITTTDYAGGYIYENGSLKLSSQPEGYIEPDGTGGYDYVYQYKDHLGNIRLSYSDNSTVLTNNHFDSTTEGWGGVVGTVLSQENGMLKAEVTEQWAGAQKYMDVTVGDEIYYELFIDKATTEHLIVHIAEHDSNYGKLTTTAVSDGANGFISGTYTVSQGSKLRIKVTKNGNDNGIPTYYYIDDVKMVKKDITIREESNYYPFGLKHKGYNNLLNGGEYPYKYQGQELTENFDYNMYEFELRHYDAALGRFITTDPYEQFHSPYLAMGNNPVVSFDPDGGYCYDANGNQIACPDEGDLYNDYVDNPDNHITILDGVEVSNSDSNDNEEETASSENISIYANHKFPAMTELSGWRHFVAEVEINIQGYRVEQGPGGNYLVDDQGNVIFGPYQGGIGAVGLIGGFYNPKKLLKVAKILDKGGLTKVGRALQKHGSRPGSKFPKTTGNPASMNAQGEKVLNDILTNPASTATTRHHARFGEILEIKAPNGQGARFSKDGKTFIGLIEN